MQTQKILVLGANGKTGRRVVERLNQSNHIVRIGSRSAQPAFDWGQPEGWAEVLQGMDKVYITFQPDLAVPGALKAIQRLTSEAIKAGVQKMVLLSGKGEKEAQNCEQVLMNSGIKWTIVRASWFNQNFSESYFLDPILAGHVALPKSEAKVPYVDANDIADVVVECLLDAQHDGKMYELTGPRQLTFPQVVQEIAEASGRTIQYSPISMEAYTAMLKDFQLPDDYIWLINYLFEEVLTEENSVISSDVEKVLGRPPIDFKEYARTVAATQIWNPVASPTE